MALVEAVDVGLHFTPHGQRFLQQSMGRGISQQQDLRVIAQALPGGALWHPGMRTLVEKLEKNGEKYDIHMFI